MAGRPRRRIYQDNFRSSSRGGQARGTNGASMVEAPAIVGHRTDGIRHWPGWLLTLRSVTERQPCCLYPRLRGCRTLKCARTPVAWPLEARHRDSILWIYQMPELPEVETVATDLRTVLVDRCCRRTSCGCARSQRRRRRAPKRSGDDKSSCRPPGKIHTDPPG